MGKTRKVSKGHSSHFVPDYRHAVETMTEVERVGSMGRGDTEMTGSEGSCAPKRRCVSLNGENCDASGVPVHVFPVSQMSHSEKMDLECRLRNELQHVRILQRRLASMGSNALPSPGSDFHKRGFQQRMASMGSNALPSTASEIRSSGGGIVRPALENLNRHVNEVTMLKGKKKPPQGRNWPPAKVSGARRPEAAKPSSTTVSMLMKQCETLLQRLMSQNVAYIFNEPVDIVKSNIPDYFTIIKQPMDLGTIKSKLLSGQYSDPLGFAADVRLTFSNAMTYNPQGNAVHDMAKTLSKFFEVRWKPIEKKFSMMVDQFPPKPSSNIESETATSKPPMKKKKVGNVEHEIKPNFGKRVMTLDEKQRLTVELDEVASELPDSIIDFLKVNTNNSSESNEGELEIDLDSLTDETLFTLRDLLNNYLSNKQKSEGKVEPCEIELHNESMFSNSSMQPCRGNDVADEDVDIGGNDAPISSFPPLEAENDGAGQNIKDSSSSSSSSDSGSSSSDSDTGSASHGDSDGRKNKTQINEKEMCNYGESLDQKGSCIGDTVGEILNGDVQPNSGRNFNSGSSIGSQEGGEDAPTERQVSPGNNYRAALLRSRFADTILKAKEKALEKDEKMDLDKLRLEREEFERIKKEDKARLLADARAAEVAHRKVEAAAAAKAKRKRELEREAARQALQKMEKTVDINENTQFLEDLEILRSAPEQSLLGVTSPDDDQNGLGSFNLQASSNPLEQLGLYMKDDDEEEEGDHHITSQMEKTVGINENTQSLVDLELLRSTPEQSLLGATSPGGNQNGIENCNLQASGNCLEQLGLYKKDDHEEEEEEEGEHRISSQMETTDINENTRSLEGLETLRAAPEQSLLGVASPDDVQNGVESYDLQVGRNTMEQLGLKKKDGDEEEEKEGEHYISSHMETSTNINENAESLKDPEQSLLGMTSPDDDHNGLGSYNLQVSSNPSEELELIKKDGDEEEEEGEHQISSQMEMTVNIDENTQSLEDLGILRSAPEQSLLGVTSPEDHQNGSGSYNLQASSNPLEQLGLYKKDHDEEEGGEHHSYSQMEMTVDSNENTQEDLEILRSSPEQSLLGMTTPKDNRNGLGSNDLQVSTSPMEQLGINKKEGDKEEEEGKVSISSQLGTTVNTNENIQSLQDLEILKSASEQSLLGVRSPKDDQNGLGSNDLQVSSNPSEHLGINMEEDAPEQSLLGVTSPEDDQNGLGSNGLQVSSNPLEHLGINMKDDGKEGEEGEHNISSQLETTVDVNENTLSQEDVEILRSAPEQSLLGVTSPEDDQNGLGSYNLQASNNSLEQLGLYKKDDDEEEGGGEHHISSQMETTVDITENTQSQEDLEILRPAPEQSLLMVTSPNDSQTGLESSNLQASSNSLEQLGLYKKDDDEEEGGGEHHISSHMETTVDITENTRSQEYLEMLPAPEQSSLVATSPNESQTGLGSYKLQASSNPLERVGLDMKSADEEEAGGP